MRICTNCGRILDDNEEICKVCNSDLILDTGETDDPEESAVISDIYGDDSSSSEAASAAPEAEDFSFAENNSDPVDEISAEETDKNSEDKLKESASSEHTVPNQENIVDPTAELAGSSLSDEYNVTTSEVSDTPVSVPDTKRPASVKQEDDRSSSEQPKTDKIKIINVKAPSEERLPHVNRSRVILVIGALLALSAVIFAVVMVVLPLVDARKQDEAARVSAYMEFLEGKWLSETFIYSGQEYPSCEVLFLNRNNTFTAEIWTSPNDRETYDAEAWTVTAKQTGEFRLELETSSLRVSYTGEDGNTMVYRRYILKLDASSLVLREYYNEKMTEYFDVVFTRYS